MKSTYFLLIASLLLIPQIVLGMQNVPTPNTCASALPAMPVKDTKSQYEQQQHKTEVAQYTQLTGAELRKQMVARADQAIREKYAGVDMDILRIFNEVVSNIYNKNPYLSLNIFEDCDSLTIQKLLDFQCPESGFTLLIYAARSGIKHAVIQLIHAFNKHGNKKFWLTFLWQNENNGYNAFDHAKIADKSIFHLLKNEEKKCIAWMNANNPFLKAQEKAKADAQNQNNTAAQQPSYTQPSPYFQPSFTSLTNAFSRINLGPQNAGSPSLYKRSQHFKY